MDVDLSRIIQAHNPKVRNQVIDDIVRASQTDPIYISDLLVDWQTAEPLLSALRKDRNKKYILYCMRDEWGNEPRAGMVVKRRFKHDLKYEVMQGMKVNIPIHELNTWKRAGTYDQHRYYYEDFVVDDKGCIKCSAEDAEYFLTHFGVHGKSGMPMSFHAIEHSEDPAPAPDGSKLHVWYWRYKEMSPEMYKELPKLEKSTEPLRGYKAA